MEKCRGLVQAVGPRSQSRSYLYTAFLPVCNHKCGIYRRSVRWQPDILSHLSRCRQHNKHYHCGSRHRLSCRAEQTNPQSTAGQSSVTIDVGQEPVSTAVDKPTAQHTLPCCHECPPDRKGVMHLDHYHISILNKP